VECQKLEPAFFSPATKAETGHDENISVDRLKTMVGAAIAAMLEGLTRTVYERGGALAAERGIIVADTKLEFGRGGDGQILLIDEVLTPDSSRFWPSAGYRAGGPQPSFDKQPLRDYLDAERRAGRWNGEAPPPRLPDDVVQATSARYKDAFRRITGSQLRPSETS
jgi:phosphoribosylaminoimidazole-succinocarboxamide synthase